MYVEEFIKNFPAEFVKSVDKNYEAQKARIVFTPQISEKYGGQIHNVIMNLDANLYINGLAFMGINLRPLQDWINNYNVFESQSCSYSVIMDGFPQYLAVVCL